MTSLPKPAQGLLLRPEIASIQVKISADLRTYDKSDTQNEPPHRERMGYSKDYNVDSHGLTPVILCQLLIDLLHKGV